MTMLRIDRRLLENVDWPLLAAAGALVLTSAVTLANLNVGRAGGAAARQLAWFGVGFVALVVVASIDYRRLVRAAPAFYLLGLAGLGAVFVVQPADLLATADDLAFDGVLGAVHEFAGPRDGVLQRRMERAFAQDADAGHGAGA